MLKPVLQPQEPPKRTILTVSQLNRQAKSTLESSIGSIWLTGEISNLTKAASGHWYFSLKDDNAQIRAAMFRFKAQAINFSPREGDQVVVKGKVSIYEARGDFQLIADFMEPAGEGDLQLKLRELMKKLQSEGLFSDELKQPLPYLPQKIGVITSPTGAAIHDVLTVLKRRCPLVPVVIYPTQVQGAQSASEIRKALARAIARDECDVLLITRGGGSLEDLWSFNDEQLARDIANCPIPIIGAVGHEVDITIAELVADVRAPTPSAAAELMVPEKEALAQSIDGFQIMLERALQQKIFDSQTALNIARLKLADPETAISASQHKLNEIKQMLLFSGKQLTGSFNQRLSTTRTSLEKNNPRTKLATHNKSIEHLHFRLKNSIAKSIEKEKNTLALKASRLNAVSPLATLARGFSIVRDDKRRVISSTNQVKLDDELEILLKTGSIGAKVISITPKD